MFLSVRLQVWLRTQRFIFLPLEQFCLVAWVSETLRPLADAELRSVPCLKSNLRSSLPAHRLYKPARAGEIALQRCRFMFAFGWLFLRTADAAKFLYVQKFIFIRTEINFRTYENIFRYRRLERTIKIKPVPLWNGKKREVYGCQLHTIL